MSHFNFAWANETETFGPEHHISDEHVFSIRVHHAEGDCPTLDLIILNPRVGLLGPGRKRWAWLSWEDNEGTVHPLYFGRIVGVPQDLHDNKVTLLFVTRRSDHEARQEVVAGPLRQLPAFDPLWLAEEERDDPNRVLDAIPYVWHVDRLSGEVTVSHVVDAEDGTVDFTNVFYGSLTSGIIESPATEVLLDASVRWDQVGQGSLDITYELRQAIKAAPAPTGLQTVKLQDAPVGTSMWLMAPESFANAWPRQGQSLGGGWTVGASKVDVVGTIKPRVAPTMTLLEFASTIESAPDNGFQRFFPAITFPTRPVFGGGGMVPGAPDVTTLPVTPVALSLPLLWEAAVARTETVRIRMTADVQPALADPGDAQTVRLTMPQASVDERVDSLSEPSTETETELYGSSEMPIGDPRRRSYFLTDRGKPSMENLMLRCFAVLIKRSRAVNLTFRVPFKEGIALSCRKSGTVVDPRLPGGVATGKITSYSLDFDGRTGHASATVTLGCPVGRDGSVTVVPGEPDYVDDDYVEDDYQVYIGGSVSVQAPGLDEQLAYDDYSNVVVDGDHLDLTAVTKDAYLKSIEVLTGWEAATIILDSGGQYTAEEITDALAQIDIAFRVEMEPVAGGPYRTHFEPTMHEVKLLRGIDLESE